MIRMLVTIVAVLMTTGSAAAQLQLCPSSPGRITLIDRDGQTYSPGGGAHICLGKASYLAVPLLTAITRNENREEHAWFVTVDGGRAIESLPADSYICLSEYEDSITVDDGSDFGDCAGKGIMPFDYGGHVLSIHALGGHDHVHGGLGKDFIFGGDGNDDLWAGDGGDGDTIYAGDGDDGVWGSSGPNSRLFGGRGNDILDDTGGIGTTYHGDGGDDLIRATQCLATEIDCGSGADTVQVPFVGRSPTPVGCESVEQASVVCPNS